MARFHGWLLALSWYACACGELVPYPDDPQLVDDGPWRCVREDQSSAAASAGGSATVRVRVCDAFAGCSTPLTGLRADLCAKLDVGCTHPLASDIRDVNGILEFNVPIVSAEGFEGYLAVTAPSELCTSDIFGDASQALCAVNPACNPQQPDDSCRVPLYVRALLFFNPPIKADTPEPIQLSLLSSAAQPALVRATRGTFDPSTGSLLLTGVDCDGAPALGVSYDMRQHEGEVSQWYMANGILSASLSQTDASGVGGFVGVPPGFVEVEAYNSEEERIGAVGVQIAAETISYTSLVPSR